MSHEVGAIAPTASTTHRVRQAYVLLHAAILFFAVAPWMFPAQAAWFIVAGVVTLAAIAILHPRTGVDNQEPWLQMFPFMTASAFNLSAILFALSQWVEPFYGLY